MTAINKISRFLLHFFSVTLADRKQAKVQYLDHSGYSVFDKRFGILLRVSKLLLSFNILI